MLTSSPLRLSLPVPHWAKFAVLGGVVGAGFYVAWTLQPAKPPDDDVRPNEPVIAVPHVDRSVLALARDDSRENRLLLEAEPLRHLLGIAIDVGPTVALALGSPDTPIPIATVRADTDSVRGRWLWYEGVLEDLTGPREGHPIGGYSIYEATVRLPNGDRVLTAFSLPPDRDVVRGSWVKVEGFLMKVRDTTYPTAIDGAPMLVGRQMLRDYEDWGPVTKLDRNLLAEIDDRDVSLGAATWHSLEQDQSEPLWHLAAFARDTAGTRSLAHWRKVGILDAGAEIYRRLLDHAVPPGEQVRVMGQLIRCRPEAAPPNPAGIKFWTTAWVQVREFGGHVIPIWIPDRVERVATGTSVEVRGFFYRWFAYEAQHGERFRVPLFVAADIDPFVVETGASMRTIGIGLIGALTILMVLLWFGQRRSRHDAEVHARAMDARRRRRRERSSQPAPASSTGETPAPS